MSESDPDGNVPVESLAPNGAPTSPEEKLARIEAQLKERPAPAFGPRMLHLHIRYPGLYLLFIAVNLLDLVITRVAIDQFGMNEANALAKGILVRLGFAGFALYKVFMTGLVIVLAEIISRTKPRWAFWIVVCGCLAIGAVVVWGAGHLIGLLLSRQESVSISQVLANP